MSQEVIDLTLDGDDNADAEENCSPESSKSDQGPSFPLPKIVMVESLAWKNRSDLFKDYGSQDNVSIEEPPTKKLKLGTPCGQTNGNSNQNGPNTTTCDQPLIEKNSLDNHSLFKKFLAECFRFEPDEKDRKRAGEKLQSYFDRATPTYISSSGFTDLLNNQMKIINSERLYFCVKDVLDELKQNRSARRAELTPVPGPSKCPSPPTNNSSEEKVAISPDCVNDKHVTKLMAALDKIDRKIKKLEAMEVDLDDEDNSAYLIMSRYRERFAKIYRKLCQITGAPLHAERLAKKKIRFNSTCYPEVNLLIERWINKKKQFPDYDDVYNLIKSQDLEMKPELIEMIAQKAFQDIGEQMQRLRKLDLWDSVECFVSGKEDPANGDSKLAAVLTENNKLFKKKEQEVFDYFVKRQVESKDRKELEEDNDDDDADENVGDASEASSVEVDVETITNAPDLAGSVKLESNNETVRETPRISKPFGTVGEVIEIDYCFIHYDVERIRNENPFIKRRHRMYYPCTLRHGKQKNNRNELKKQVKNIEMFPKFSNIFGTIKAIVKNFCLAINIVEENDGTDSKDKPSKKSKKK